MLSYPSTWQVSGQPVPPILRDLEKYCHPSQEKSNDCPASELEEAVRSGGLQGAGSWLTWGSGGISLREEAIGST